MIAEGDIVVPMVSDDGEVVAMRATRVQREGDLCVPVMAADGVVVGEKAVSLRAKDALGFPGRATDEAVALRFGCYPYALAKKFVDAYLSWDLSEFVGRKDLAPPGSVWRIVNMTDCHPAEAPWHGCGCVDRQGRLDGLRSIDNHYYYGVWMHIQIGCVDAGPDKNGLYWVTFPGTCQNRVRREYFPCLEV